MATSERFDLEALLSSLTQGTLRPRDDISEPDWRFWERRNLNMHRVVALWKPQRRPASASELGAEARAMIGRHFRCAWWRGLGFGVVADLDEISLTPEDATALIDGRENSRGTWQWILLVSRSRKALGVHTWSVGYLSPLYRALLDRLALDKIQVTSVCKKKDGLMELLTAVKPRAFPEFRDAS